MADLVMLLKPPVFKVKKVGDPEQLSQDFNKYIVNFKEFLEVTEVDGEHAAGHPPAAGGLCSGCKKAKAILKPGGWGEDEEPAPPCGASAGRGQF